MNKIEARETYGTPIFGQYHETPYDLQTVRHCMFVLEANDMSEQCRVKMKVTDALYVGR